MAREIKSIRLNFHIEKTTGKGRGIGDVGSKEGVAGGRNAVGWGNKIHLDGSPFDAEGKEIGPEDPAWNDVPKVNDGYVFTEWRWDGEAMGGPIDLGSIADNYGCTPTVKANKRDEDKARHELVVWQVYAKGTPQEVKSDELTFAID